MNKWKDNPYINTQVYDNSILSSWSMFANNNFGYGTSLNSMVNKEYCCCDTRTNSSESLVSNLTIQQALDDLNRTNNLNNNKENKTMINNNNNNGMMNAFNGMFGKLENGACRLSMHGGIAVKTSNGYKTYNVKTGRLVNCSNFVFPIGDEMFFVIPTNKIENGDIILVAGKPRCVIDKDKSTITVINYEDSTIEKILPERHIFMGNTYFYGKIVSMFGDDLTGDKKGMNKIMKYMMLSEMMGRNSLGTGNNSIGNLMTLMLLGGNMGDLFGDIFNFEDDNESDDDNEAEEIPTTPLISE